MNKNKAFTPILILIVALILVVAGVVGYLVLRPTVIPENTSMNYSPLPSAAVEPTPAPVTNSENTKTLQMELNQTDSGSIDSDINSLNSDASSL